MGLKSDSWIRKMSVEKKMIVPFAEEQVGRGVVSYGLSSYGYDIRVAREFKIFTNVGGTVVDPKNFDAKNVVDFEGDVCIVPPNSFALARTIEYFKMPRDVLAICLGKSTYARCGIIVNAKIYANEGIAQVWFMQGDEPCEVSYCDKKGKYQSQKGITLPRILKD